MPETDRLFAPATARNGAPILAVLRGVLPPSGMVLEIASGTGEHVSQFAAALPHLMWQPTDAAPSCRASIDAWAAGLANVLPARSLDAAAAWPFEQADAVLCINLIHIAPWEAAIGLFKSAARVLPAGGPIVLYGPYRRSPRPLEPGNAAFDADLRSRDPAWGLRELDKVVALASGNGFGPAAVREMPANNLTLVFRKT